MNTINITARVEPTDHNGRGTKFLAYIDSYDAGRIGGCPMGRGLTEEAAIADLIQRSQWQANADNTDPVTVQLAPATEPATIKDSANTLRRGYGPDYPTPHWAKAPTLNLIADGRDIDRIVDVFGNELRLTHCDDGQLLVSMADGQHMDYFTQADWDLVLDGGTVRTLDPVAGTVVTTVNW